MTCPEEDTTSKLERSSWKIVAVRVRKCMPGDLCASHVEANTEHTHCYPTVEACDAKEASESLEPKPGWSKKHLASYRFEGT
jgi:hypothetical protein